MGRGAETSPLARLLACLDWLTWCLRVSVVLASRSQLGLIVKGSNSCRTWPNGERTSCPISKGCLASLVSGGSFSQRPEFLSSHDDTAITMRLINIKTLELEEFFGGRIPRYDRCPPHKAKSLTSQTDTPFSRTHGKTRKSPFKTTIGSSTFNNASGMASLTNSLPNSA